jgi:hypothetical protein
MQFGNKVNQSHKGKTEKLCKFSIMDYTEI